MNLRQLETMEERVQLLKEVVQPFKQRAWKHDREATFPKDNIEDLKKAGYTSLTVPKQYGGKEISLFEMVQHQETIGAADGATSLSIGWHIGLIKHLGETRVWDESIYEKVCQDVLHKHALINAAATEAQTGSPTRGGKPGTTAKKMEGNWYISGRKIFTTMSPVLNYFIVSAAIEGTDDVANFLIPKESKGLQIEETWDMMAMRATGSHDLVLENVKIGEEGLVEYITPGNKPAAGWLLHIPACYLGIARAAQEYAISFAKQYSPNSIQGTISDLPHVRQKIGEMELRLLQARSFLHAIANKWDQTPFEERQLMNAELGAVKHAVVSHAIEVVDLAMRVVGALSLSNKNPLQRYYRDVRAGLHNPPMDEMTVMLLAKEAMERIGEKP
ncbi:acyl-CoA dehydrogenase family protein [Halalkalibacterium ligniniphilum]|uniref:acyl-CoA dehydrogenase family protein n=1 Tax=Halalkalibacterium ligniniphilum TaxID=1134413 RepID=UPI00037EEC3E|nr:acyl-CoA dehydrogenase family protein [Halalkalibacterium ligniniphilum]